MPCKYKGIKVDGKKKDFHRYLMEKHLGRTLNRNEEVHHKDGNKLNNDISNLVVMNISEHRRLHMKGYTPTEQQRRKFRESGIKNRTKAKLSIDQVREIKKGLMSGIRPMLLAKHFGVDAGTITKIKKGETWDWVS